VTGNSGDHAVPRAGPGSATGCKGRVLGTVCSAHAAWGIRGVVWALLGEGAAVLPVFLLCLAGAMWSVWSAVAWAILSFPVWYFAAGRMSGMSCAWVILCMAIGTVLLGISPSYVHLAGPVVVWWVALVTNFSRGRFALELGKKIEMDPNHVGR